MAADNSFSDIRVEYFKNKIYSFDGFVGDLMADNGSLLITSKGEMISDRDYDSGVKSMDGDLLSYEGIARRIAADKGYLFFGAGSVDNKGVFSRKFSYKDFVDAINGMRQNVNPKTTCNGRSYTEHLSDIYDGLSNELDYLGDVSLKWDTKGIGKNIRIIGSLDSSVIRAGENKSGLMGVSLEMGLQGMGSNEGLVLREKKLIADVYSDVNFSDSDFDIFSSAVLKKGGESDPIDSDRFVMDRANGSFLNMNFDMLNKRGRSKIVSTAYMIDRFSNYLSAVFDGVKAVKDLKRLKHREDVNNLLDYMSFHK